jgi:hypothetical protein
MKLDIRVGDHAWAHTPRGVRVYGMVEKVTPSYLWVAYTAFDEKRVLKIRNDGNVECPAAFERLA